MRVAYRIYCALLLVSALSIPCKSQVPQSLTTFPALISMCEDSDGCSNWYLKEGKGTAVWATGANADLTVTHLDATSIRVHRTDSKGPLAGMVVDYTGTISNFWIEGDLIYTWPSHGVGPTHVKWHGLVFPPFSFTSSADSLFHNARSHSEAWKMCQSYGEECSAARPPVNSLMVFTEKVGYMEITADYSVEITTYIDELPGGIVVMRRFDMKGTYQGATGIYIGKRVGNRIDGTFKTIWPGHMKNPMAGKWNATAAPVRCGPTMDVETEKYTGELANLSGDKASGLSCYTAAADKGDAEAEDFAGYYYYVGWGGAPDYKKAQAYLRESVARGNKNAMFSLSTYYKESKWGPPNLLLANYYGNLLALGNAEKENFATSFFFRGDELPITVAHEAAVIQLMDRGMSRVDAEVDVFKREDGAKPKDQGDPEERCPTGSKAQYNMSLSPQQRDDASFKHTECVEAIERATNRGRDYLRCVQSYKDSNAIEENCRYFH